MTRADEPLERSLNDYIAGPDVLGYQFQYPPEYLECIAWGHKDLDAGGDGHGLSFLKGPEVREDLITFVRNATHRRLVPFARGGNGDELYCFDGRDSNAIYVINLGERPLRIRKTECANFVKFIDFYRSNLDLPDWDRDQEG